VDSIRLFRGQSSKYDRCLFVPSALRGYWPNYYPFSAIGCCNDCSNILKVEIFLHDLGIDTDLYKKECEVMLKKEPFQECLEGINYIFWLSIVYCDIKTSHMGKNTSFSNTGYFPYTINKGFPIEKRNGSIIFNINGTKIIEEYAIKMAQYYFEHNPPAKSDDFVRKYMDHQHYCKKSCGYDTFPKGYKSKNGIIVDGKELPDHFTLLLDWTKDEHIAKEFAGVDGTILSIDLEKYINLVGDNYQMSYNDEIIENMLIDTAEPQKSIVTFWPWTFTINELENNELGKALNFSRKKLNGSEV
jgi:hypothetical protein